MATDLVSASLALASQHVRLFACKYNTKVPAITEFSKFATDDPIKLRELFSKKNCNSGIACGKVSEGLYLVGFDIDNKEGRNGFETLLDLELSGKRFPDSWSQKTPSGGEHRLYWSPIEIRQGTNVPGPGIDFRSTGGYLVGPGSAIDGKYYEVIKDTKIAMFPDFAIQEFRKDTKVIQLAKTPLREVKDQVLALQRSVEFLKTREAIAHGGRNDEAFKVIAKLKDFGLDYTQMEDVLLTYWKCEPMLEIEEIKHVMNSVFKYSQSPAGFLAPENVFEPVVKDPKEKIKTPEPPELIFNKDHFYVASEGNSWVGWETESWGEFHLERFPVHTFHEKYAARSLIASGGQQVPLTKIWIKSPNRREYVRVRFDPANKETKGIYNLWRGFAVKEHEDLEPVSQRGQEAVNMFLEHLLENVCSNDKALFQWLVGFFAHIFQYPGEKPQVALVFQGKKGTGKSIVSKIIGHLIGQKHVVTLPDKSHLVNHFNALMEDKLLITLEEAFWSGDKSVEGLLKSLITDPQRVITYKGAQPYMTYVYDRIVIIGNDDHIVPASGEERRFAVFSVGDGKMQNQNYFVKMKDGIIKHGGDKILMRFFKDFDLKKININIAPHTKGLDEQKENSLGIFERWWLDCLKDEKLHGSNLIEWPDKISVKEFYEAFANQTNKERIKAHIPSQIIIGKLLRRIHPHMWYLPRKLNGTTTRIYQMPLIDVARYEWDQYLGMKTQWD